MKKLIGWAALTLLVGCAASTEPQVREVRVQVTVPCVSQAPVKPDYRYGKGPMPSDKEMAALLAADFEAAERYGQAWEAATVGCLR